MNFFDNRIKAPTTDGQATGTTIPSQAPTRIGTNQVVTSGAELSSMERSAKRQVTEEIEVLRKLRSFLEQHFFAGNSCGDTEDAEDHTIALDDLIRNKKKAWKIIEPGDRISFIRNREPGRGVVEKVDHDEKIYLKNCLTVEFVFLDEIDWE